MTTRDRDPEQAPVIAEAFALPDGGRAVWAIEPDGSACAWLLAPTCSCGYCPEPTVGCADAATAPHEQLGPLPLPVLSRIAATDAQRCGRPTRSGRPCRAFVSDLDGVCRHHRWE